MKVEIEISDLSFGSFYLDERCKRVEEILHDSDKFQRFRVKRVRRYDDSEKDPYYVMDHHDKYWVWMNPWEIDELNDRGVLEYITVVKETSYQQNPFDNYLILGSLLVAVIIVFIINIIISPELASNLYIQLIIFGSLIGIIILTPISKKKISEHKENERACKARLISENPLYLEAMQKFTTLSYISAEQRKEYESLLEEIESDIADS
ncbi:MAG: hypothetical protein GF411_20655 [Candidatus Lokiarchaeota archaeon]|nr:hypothetical protein [Candidatus Lokiarchaeota archaeon]